MTAQFEKNTQTELTYIKHFSNKIELFLDTNFLLSFHLIDYKQPNILVQKQEPHEHETRQEGTASGRRPMDKETCVDQRTITSRSCQQSLTQLLTVKKTQSGQLCLKVKHHHSRLPILSFDNLST